MRSHCYAPAVSLTESETGVIALVAEGYTNAQIAERFVCSPETVKTHVEHILEKLGAKNRREAGRIWRASQEKIPRSG